MVRQRRRETGQDREMPRNDPQAALEYDLRGALGRYEYKMMHDWQLAAFQEFARRTAKVVKEKGFENVSPFLKAVAQNVQDIGDEGWRDAIKLGNALLNAADSKPKESNPFAGMKFGQRHQ